MIGCGDTIGIHLIDGHHLDMTDGDTIGTHHTNGNLLVIIGVLTNIMVGIITVGIMGSTIDIEVLTQHTIQVEEELQLQEMVEHTLL